MSADSLGDRISGLIQSGTAASARPGRDSGTPRSGYVNTATLVARATRSGSTDNAVDHRSFMRLPFRECRSQRNSPGARFHTPNCSEPLEWKATACDNNGAATSRRHEQRHGPATRAAARSARPVGGHASKYRRTLGAFVDAAVGAQVAPLPAERALVHDIEDLADTHTLLYALAREGNSRCAPRRHSRPAPLAKSAAAARRTPPG